MEEVMLSPPPRKMVTEQGATLVQSNNREVLQCFRSSLVWASTNYQGFSLLMCLRCSFHPSSFSLALVC